MDGEEDQEATCQLFSGQRIFGSCRRLPRLVRSCFLFVADVVAAPNSKFGFWIALFARLMGHWPQLRCRHILAQPSLVRRRTGARAVLGVRAVHASSRRPRVPSSRSP